MGVMTKDDFPHLLIEEKNGSAHILLDEYELKIVESFEIKKGGEDNLLPGTATLTLRIAVKYP